MPIKEIEGIAGSDLKHRAKRSAVAESGSRTDGASKAARRRTNAQRAKK
jgi:hypothetical protein